MRGDASDKNLPPVFLTACWRNLVMLNYEVDPKILRKPTSSVQAALRTICWTIWSMACETCPRGPLALAVFP